MDTKQVMEFKLFGGFSYRIGSVDEWSSLEQIPTKGVGKKQMAFLCYLLLNHGRHITSAELIERFWPETSKDPANTLKNTIHKTRALLHSMFPACGDILVTKNGGYAWNTTVTVSLDVDEFESLYRAAKASDGADRVRQGLEAFDLYQGNILSGDSLQWLEHLNTYYRTMFVDLCKTLALSLQEQDRWDEVARVCKQAYLLEPSVEEFTVCFMQALLSMGMPELATKHYEAYRLMLWQEYDLVPSEQVEHLYTLAVEFSGNTAQYEQELVRQITQVSEESTAFHCSLLVFRNVVALELRSMARTKHPSSIVLLRTHKPDNSKPSAADIRRLERVLLYSLRAGDPFTRLNMGSFALLLPGAAAEDAARVIQRVESNFRNAYPRAKAKLNYRVFPLTPDA